MTQRIFQDLFARLSGEEVQIRGDFDVGLVAVCDDAIARLEAAPDLEDPGKAADLSDVGLTDVGVAGHLSRVFRRTTGTTLKQFVIQQRVELAKRTLLDPSLERGGGGRALWLLQSRLLRIGL